ncbi:MAG: hypothetical protein ABIJ48_12980 [Actinomycetota bacterium]
MSARRAASPRWSRSGLPTVCGVKLPDGRECMKRAGPFGACDAHSDWRQRPRVPATLDPLCFGDCYLAWLRGRGREPVIPDDLGRFLGWWRTLPTVDKIPVPWSMDLYQVQVRWRTWCRLTGHPRLIPFDLTLFCEWWKVT